MKTIRVAILGAECSGKTTLCYALKTVLSDLEIITKIAPEALREFCGRHQRVPRREEQLGIMRDQQSNEGYAESRLTTDKTNLLLSDCAPITIAIYSELYFSDTSLYPEAQTHHEKYDLSILLTPNIGWQQDGIFRESPQAQQRFHHRMKQWLASSTHPWLEISEVADQRTMRAMSAIIALIR
jgi:HTH-type transcriptional regulator, transcriptional repressor of NAD biosynthesis genes